MIVALCNGRYIKFDEACNWDNDGESLLVLGQRKRVIATFRLEAVAGWWYDNEEYTTWGTTDRLERP